MSALTDSDTAKLKAKYQAFKKVRDDLSIFLVSFIADYMRLQNDDASNLHSTHKLPVQHRRRLFVERQEHSNSLRQRQVINNPHTLKNAHIKLLAQQNISTT